MNKVKVPKKDATIAALHECFNAEKKNSVQIGRLLCQLKEQVEHGQWLPLLEREFSLTDRTARNYMGAHRFLIHVAKPILKSEKFSDLRLRPSALYELASLYDGVEDFEFDKPPEFMDDDRVIPILPADIEAILKEAKEQWVGSKRIRDVLRERHPPEPEPVSWPSSEPEPSSEEQPDEGEPEPEPEPEDSPPPNPERTTPRSKSDLDKFADDIADLKKLFLGSVNRLVDASVPDSDIETVRDSLTYFLKMRDAGRTKAQNGNDIPTDQSRDDICAKFAAMESSEARPN